MSVEEIRRFVLANPGATAMEIRDGLGQKVETDDVYNFPHPDRRKGRAFFIQDVTREFYRNLQEFMRSDDVEVKQSVLAHLITDNEVYISEPGMHYFPITIRITSKKNK